MVASVLLGVWNSNKFQSIKIENIDLANNVEALKNEASQKLDQQKATIELVYCGLILQDDQSLLSYGVTNGATIHVVKKPLINDVPKNEKINESEIQQFVDDFTNFKETTRYRAVMLSLRRPEILEPILMAYPGLLKDPTALTIIQDDELVNHMVNIEIVRRIIEKHPIIIQVLNYVMTNIQEEQVSLTANQPSTSTGYSYSLDALSDDEDMDSANSDSNRDSNPLTRNASYNAITAAQLAAAISNATNTSFNSTELPTTPTTSGNVITNEMFSNAIQQAFASSSFGSSAVPNPSTPNEGESIEAVIRRLQPQLNQMHEMGLTNVSVNVRALQATSGDVQAAVELVFNGVID